MSICLPRDGSFDMLRQMIYMCMLAACFNVDIANISGLLEEGKRLVNSPLSLFKNEHDIAMHLYIHASITVASFYSDIYLSVN